MEENASLLSPPSVIVFTAINFTLELLRRRRGCRPLLLAFMESLDCCEEEEEEEEDDTNSKSFLMQFT
jgi:hypothetical protein